MPAPSPAADLTNASLRVTVKLAGTALKETILLESIKISHEINRISLAEIVLTGMPGDYSAVSFSDDDTLAPGSVVSITAGYGDSGEVAIFSGYLLRHSLELSSGGIFRARLVCRHKAIVMTYGRKESEYKEKTDSDIITALTGNYGLSATVEATSASNENFIQKLATDWDLMLSRAEFNGMMVFMDATDAITVGKPVVSGSPVLRIAPGDSLIAFSGELNAENQAPSVEAKGWDPANLTLLSATATEPSLNSQGDVTAKSLSAKMSQKKDTLTTLAPLSAADLKTWADGHLMRMRLSAIKGSVTFFGSALVKTGDLITLEGVGSKFNGDAYVSGVSHTLFEGAWTTKVRFGLERKTVTELPDFSYQNGAGQIPAIHGLQVATVKKLSEDPLSEGRIQVTLPTSAETANGIWARLTAGYATNAAGSGIYPEVGDEVIIGFIENDPRFAVVLGSLHGKKNTPPFPPADENNYLKQFTSKSNISISIDDEKKIVTVKTPGNNSVVISDEGKSIELKDQNSNSLLMDSSGITIKSGKDVVISATKDFKVSATGKIDLKATQDLAAAGLNVNLTAQVGLTAKGQATAEISASGQTTVKGAIVMIN